MDNESAHTHEQRLRAALLAGLAGDGAAYHGFLKEMTAHLRAYFRRRLRGLPDEVEDLLQETLLALHLQRGTYDTGVPVTAWVHGIARHKLVDLWRRRGRRDSLHDAIDDVDEQSLAAEIIPIHHYRWPKTDGELNRTLKKIERDCSDQKSLLYKTVKHMLNST